MRSILLIGLGRFGKHIAMKLSELSQEVLAIDVDEDRVNEILPYVSNAYIGDCTNVEFMKSIGVKNFDVCIVAIGDDFQSSLETTSILKELGANKVVSRAASDRQSSLLLRIGADEVVYPEKEIANWTAIKYSSQHVFDYFELGGDFSICEVEAPLSWVGKSVGEIDIRRKYSINILAIKQNGKMNPLVLPDTTFQANCSLLVMGAYKDIQKCFRL